MNNKKPDSLFQSMEKWIDLYRDINTCTHDQAHDAFEAWAEKLRGESSDQTTTLFHEAVKASFEEMLKGVLQPSSEDGWMERTLDQAKRSLDGMVEVPGSGKPRPPVSEMRGGIRRSMLEAPGMFTSRNVITSKPQEFSNTETGRVIRYPEKGSWLERNLKDHPETLARIVEFTGQGAVSHDDSVKANLLGLSSLLESPHESRSAEGSMVSTNIREQWKNTTWSEPGQLQGGPVGGPILETGKDPLSFNEPKVSPDKCREIAEKTIEVNTGFLINTKHDHDHPAVVGAREAIATARSYLEMLDGVKERAKDRKTLSLKR
mgnify:FL=1